MGIDGCATHTEIISKLDAKVQDLCKKETGDITPQPEAEEKYGQGISSLKLNYISFIARIAGKSVIKIPE